MNKKVPYLVFYQNQTLVNSFIQGIEKDNEQRKQMLLIAQTHEYMYDIMKKQGFDMQIDQDVGFQFMRFTTELEVLPTL